MVSEKSLSLRVRLNRLAVQCPHCQQVWLAPGLASGDRYACKECGAVFVKRGAGGSPQPSDLQCPRPSRDAG